MRKTVYIVIQNNTVYAYSNLTKATQYHNIPYFKAYRALKGKAMAQIGEYTIHSTSLK